MATWREMSLENQKAAKQLIQVHCYRSSISRSYYAAYCAVTGELAGRFTFGYGGNNPSHTDLPNLILHNLTPLSESRRWEIRKAFRRMWKARVEADYDPSSLSDRTVALNTLRDTSRVLMILSRSYAVG